MSEWFETFFDALANDVWRALMPDDASEAEADYLLRALDLTGRDDPVVLDLACGEGRLAFRVAKGGPRVVGVDLSANAVERFRRDAAGAGEPRPVVRHGDLRDVAELTAADAPFDGAYLMGNSFGYLDPAGTFHMLEGVATNLRRGARLVIDDPVAAECLLPGMDPTAAPDRYERDDVLLEVENRYDLATSTVVGLMTLRSGGTEAVREVRHRVSTVRETVEALDRCGFDVVALEDGLEGAPFLPGGGRLMIVAVRR